MIERTIFNLFRLILWPALFVPAIVIWTVFSLLDDSLTKWNHRLEKKRTLREAKLVDV